MMRKSSLGLHLWQKGYMPKRYLLLMSLTDILGGIVQLTSMGWLMSNWTYELSYRLTRRWFRHQQRKGK